MNIFISINGCLRNLIQKFDYHYYDAYINSEIENNDFIYTKSDEPINNSKSLDNYYSFQSKEEYEHFLYIEYPIEIFGHAGLLYPKAFTDLHELIYNNPDDEFTIIGMDEFGKAKPATLFFLSKNGFLGNNIKFIKHEEILTTWNDCDMWITDSELILNLTPENKIGVKFNNNYNKHFEFSNEINDLKNTNDLWKKKNILT